MAPHDRKKEDDSQIQRNRQQTRVLVVDDAESIRKQIEQILLTVRSDLAITLCGSGTEALAHLQENSPHLAIFDLNLGVGEPNGEQLLSLAKKVARQKDQDLISLIVTGENPSPQLLKRLEERGADGFISKSNFLEAQVRLELAARLRSLDQMKELRQAHGRQKRTEKQLRSALDDSQRQKAYFEELFNCTPIALVVLDPDDRIQDVNPSFTEMFGYGKEEVQSKKINDVIVPDVLKSEAMGLTKSVAEGQQVSFETQRKGKDGQMIQVHILGCPVALPVSGGTKQLAVLGIYQDITERKRAEDTLRYLALHDNLTGLLNRTFFDQHLELELRRAQRSKEKVAVIFLDLDHFKVINDDFGHPVGDELLKQVASRLMQFTRNSDPKARYGGDEFVMYLPNVGDEKNALIRAEKIRQEIFGVPFKLFGHDFIVTASLGVSVYSPEQNVDLREVVKHADDALYEAKEGGRDRVCMAGDKKDEKV